MAIALAVGALALAGGAPAEAGGGCHDTILKDERGVAVDLKGSCFWPTVVRIDEGQQITWTNRDDTAHTVTGVANSWGTSDQMSQGNSVTYSFAKSGVFPYFCYLHPSMVGAVVVGDGRAASTGTSAGDSVSAVSARVSGSDANSPAGAKSASADSGDGVAVPLVIGIGLLAAMGGFVAASVLRRKSASS